MENMALKKLILSTNKSGDCTKNKVGNKGAESIARALKANTTLEELALEDISPKKSYFLLNCLVM